MPPVSRASFREAVQRAEAPAVAAFLGAVRRAEGATVAVDRTTVVARTPDGSETTYAVLPGNGTTVGGSADDAEATPAAAADVVVTTGKTADGTTGKTTSETAADRGGHVDPRTPDDRRKASGSGDATTVLGPDDLYRLVASGVDREATRRACREHLGLAVDGWDATAGEGAEADAGGERDDSTGDTCGERAPGGTGRRPGATRVPSVDVSVPSVRAVVPLALAVAGLVVLTSFVVAAGVTVGPFGSDGAGDGPDATAGPTAGEGADELPSYALVGGGGKYPPGVSPTGLTNPTALADAHRDAVANASYELTYTYSERSGDGNQATREVTVWVAAEDVFRADVSTAGEFRDSAPSFVDRPRYANGSRVFEQRGEPGERWYRTYPVRPSGGADDYADDARRYLHWFLTVEESSVVERFERDGTTYFRVDLRGDPWPGIDDVSGSAVVDEHGVVHSIRRRYTDENGDGSSVTVTMTYTAFGTATVEPPAWFDDAVAATRDGSTAGTPPGTVTASADGEKGATTERPGAATPTARE